MTVPYIARLACLCLATFFIAHTAFAAMVALIAHGAIRRATDMRPHTAARLLLWLRLLPPIGAGLLIIALCIPSYLLLEPNEVTEQIGPLCLILALLGTAILSSGFIRAAAAAIRSTRYARTCESENAPVLLLAGLFRQRIIVSPSMRQTLTSDELDVAIRHEQGHSFAHDNLKRLFLSIAPGVFPFTHAFQSLDAAWRTFTEWAADDIAVQGSENRAVALASALVRVARLRTGVSLVSLSASLLSDTNHLSHRVNRLIEGRNSYAPAPTLLLSTLCAILLAAIALSSSAFPIIYQLLETLAH